MVAIASKVQLSFDEYLREYPQGEGFFELVDGELVKMEAIRAHKNISRFLVKIFHKESERLVYFSISPVLILPCSFANSKICTDNLGKDV